MNSVLKEVPTGEDASVETDDLDMLDASGGAAEDPSALYQGYNSFNNKVRSTAVKGKTEGGKVSKTVMRYRICTDLEQVSSALSISASLAASCGFGSMDAKSEFVRSLNVSSTSVHIVAYVSVVTDQLRADDVEINTDRFSSASDFYRKYGDSYVNSINKGGEYAAVYSFYSKTIDERTNVLATLSASGITTSGTISASLQISLDSALHSVATRHSLDQRMDGVANHGYPAPPDIMAFALDFPTLVTGEGAVTLDYTTSSYVDVFGFPEDYIPDFLSIDENVLKYLGKPDKLGWSGLFAKAKILMASAQAARDIYTFYQYDGDTQFSQNIALLEADITSWDDLFSTVSRKPMDQYSPQGLHTRGWTPPVLNFQIGTTRLSNGNGDQTFCDVSHDDVLQNNRIEGIVLRGGDCLDSITVTYARGGKSFTMDRRGGDGGNAPVELRLNANARITQIQTAYGDYVNWISFAGKNLTEVSCPGEPEPCPGRGSWVEPADGHTRLLGFSGNFGNVMDHLEAVTVTFSPASFGSENGPE